MLIQLRHRQPARREPRDLDHPAPRLAAERVLPSECCRCPSSPCSSRPSPRRTPMIRQSPWQTSLAPVNPKSASICGLLPSRLPLDTCFLFGAAQFQVSRNIEQDLEATATTHTDTHTQMHTHPAFQITEHERAGWRTAPALNLRSPPTNDAPPMRQPGLL